MPHVYYSEITTLSILLFSLLCVCVNAHICVSSLPQWVHVDHAFLIRLLSVPLFPDLFVSLNVHLVTQFTFTFLQFHPKYLLHLVRMNQGSVWTLLHLVVLFLVTSSLRSPHPCHPKSPSLWRMPGVPVRPTPGASASCSTPAPPTSKASWRPVEDAVCLCCFSLPKIICGKC